MSKGNTTENDMVRLVFHGDDPSWRASGNLYVSLHTADPGEGGNQTSSECAYTPYARVLVTKDVTGWNVTGPQATNAEDLIWAECASGSETITHVGVGTASSGAGQLLYSGPLVAPRAVSAGIEPRIATSLLQIVED